MEEFISEYSVRSILPHLNTVGKRLNSINYHYYSSNNNNFNNLTATATLQHHYNSSIATSGTDNPEHLDYNVNDAYDNDDVDNSSDNLLQEAGNNDNLYFIQPAQQLLLSSLIDSNEDGERIEMSSTENANLDYFEYLSIKNDNSSSLNASFYQSPPASTASTLMQHLLDSLAKVTTTTLTAKHNESHFYDSTNNHNETYSIYFSCNGESQPAENYFNASSNSSWNMEDYSAAESESGWSSIYFKTAVYLMYIPIFVFALLGNGTVCYIVQSTPRMRTVTNYFIANLAVGDILMSLFCVPSSFISMFILSYWPFGRVLCHFVNYSQAVSVLVSAYTLVAISIDRYIAIMWPLRPRITKRYAKFIIAGIWLIALATAFPIPIVSRLEQPAGWHQFCDRYVCQEKWPTDEQSYYYTLALLTLQFIVPLSVLIFTYTRIALAVWGKRPPGEAENSRDQRMARSKRKMIKMMVTVVIVFTICWLPFNILSLLLNDKEFLNWDPLPYFWFAFHWLAMSHSCYNPIIYCYMNARFRGGFLQIIYRVPGLRRCCCLRRYLRTRGDRSYEATDDAFHLQRVNTCTTYISTRRKLRTNSMLVSQSSCAETTVLR